MKILGHHAYKTSERRRFSFLHDNVPSQKALCPSHIETRHWKTLVRHVIVCFPSQDLYVVVNGLTSVCVLQQHDFIYCPQFFCARPNLSTSPAAGTSNDVCGQSRAEGAPRIRSEWHRVAVFCKWLHIKQ